MTHPLSAELRKLYRGGGTDIEYCYALYRAADALDELRRQLNEIKDAWEAAINSDTTKEPK